MVEALSTAWLTRQAGDNINAIAYGEQVILGGKELQKALDLISERGAQPNSAPTEIVQQLIPELLAARLAQAEQYARECLGEAAVYRELLETCYRAATKASEAGKVELLHTEMTLHQFHVPGREQARSWGKDFVYAYGRDASWLHMTKRMLEKIEAEAEKLPESDPQIAEIKQRIKDAAKDGLIPHI